MGRRTAGESCLGGSGLKKRTWLRVHGKSPRRKYHKRVIGIFRWGGWSEGGAGER